MVIKRRVVGKPNVVRATPGGKPAAKSSRPRSAPPKTEQKDFLDALVDASAHALGLAIDPAWRASVKINLQLILDHAARVEASALADDAEPAPVFHA
jgi:hypothetical protein